MSNVLSMTRLVKRLPSFNIDGAYKKSCVVPISLKRKDSLPLFLFHAVGGNVFFYQPLANYLEDVCPIYGVQAQQYVEGAISQDEIVPVEEMARNYLKSIRLVQPEDPYRLAGASFGGVLAYEVARLLHQDNQEISFIAMFDTPGPIEVLPEFQNNSGIISYLMTVIKSEEENIDVEMLKKLNPNELFSYAKSYFEELKIKFPLGSVEQMQLYTDTFTKNCQSLANYVISHWHTNEKFIYIRAKERDRFNPLNPECDWQEILGKDLTLHETAGNHTTMNIEPHVKEMAKILKIYLDVPAK